jgi:hypothetical protein
MKCVVYVGMKVGVEEAVNVFGMFETSGWSFTSSTVNRPRPTEGPFAPSQRDEDRTSGL